MMWAEPFATCSFPRITAAPLTLSPTSNSGLRRRGSNAATNSATEIAVTPASTPIIAARRRGGRLSFGRSLLGITQEVRNRG